MKQDLTFKKCNVDASYNGNERIPANLPKTSDLRHDPNFGAACSFLSQKLPCTRHSLRDYCLVFCVYFLCFQKVSPDMNISFNNMLLRCASF